MSKKDKKEDSLVVSREDGFVVVRFNRPEKRNALTRDVLDRLNRTLDELAEDDGVGAVVFTGGGENFVAGADISELKDMPTYAQTYMHDVTLRTWKRLSSFPKPMVAAVAGYALGGGCEIAMMCDIIIADETAVFGQPEVLVGVMPGAGGTQRLVRAVGKAKAMEMCLTGRRMDAKEAESSGLVSRIVPKESLMDEAMEVAARIASLSRPLVCMIKESVNQAQEVGLTEGLRFERQHFHATLALEDRKEGTKAFLEKRKPRFKHK